MGIKNDAWIKEQSIKHKMIEPFVPRLIRKGKISYGLSSYGYDFRIANEFKVFTDTYQALVDPKKFDQASFINLKGNVCVMPPNSFVLGRSVEYFKIPREVLGICIGKSSYARCGIVINVTPLEPEWEGYLTLEISNTSPLPAKIYANEGIAQLIFIGGQDACTVSYKDRKGKYQKQKGITLPKL